MATEYATLKVPELKKLLAEKGLPQTGNKADLVARLQDNDKKDSPKETQPAAEKEDEINYSDDEGPVAPVEAKPAVAPEPAAAAPVSAPAPAVTADTNAAAPADEPSTEAAKAEGEPAAEEAPAAPAPNFALGLSSTSADDEAKKRAERAKRFGIEEDEEAKRRADRAKRFGLDEKELATGLDSALPERPLKRGRGRGEGEGSNPGKRQATGNQRNPRRSGRNRGPPPAGVSKGGNQSRNQPRKSILDDPAEKAKAEKRAARFATS